ncbi:MULTISPECIES: B12-binding domain-containing radical SAM protein [Halobacillus]|uniref:B12-binding domain-containing radical SAM protein n=1 Tax=Halobacillus TaxID=45667 RepID=UPI0009A683FF|nr:MULTISPECIES: radical SAM protein [Halobacillus]
MKTLFLYPPIFDPTSGYHSLSYLKSYIEEHRDYHIDIIDTNIEAIDKTFSKDYYNRLKTHVSNRINALNNKEELNGLEQHELKYLLLGNEFEYDNLWEAVSIMRNEEMFYDYNKYRYSAETISNWMKIISVYGFPGQFDGFSLTTQGYINLNSSSDLKNRELTRKIMKPLVTFFEKDLFYKIYQQSYNAIGINITYNFQTPFALEIARMIKDHFPNLHIFFGGTEVADIWKYSLNKNTFFEVFNCADACVVGEGEIAILELLDCVEHQKSFHPLKNVIFHPKHNIPLKHEIQYNKINNIPTPQYGDLPWDKYLSPHNFIYYSPSRGCYWNKCTFCDYGLNSDSPTSPWRQNPIEKTVEDLRVLSQNYKYIYFSVDVLAPAMLLKLAEKLINERIDIRWGAEIRLEGYWSAERCELLKESGCTCISVGYESGTQRVLDLINKGTTVDKIKETIQNFNNANIGVQMMGFIDFPTETFDEAMDTFSFLEESKEDWTMIGIGEFSLTPGAIVAKDPQRFKIKNVRGYNREDIPRSLYYEEETTSKTDREKAMIADYRVKLTNVHFGRPWIGGIDTPHTMFYHDKYGTRIGDQLLSVENYHSREEIYHLNGRIVNLELPFDISELFDDDQLTNLHNIANENIEGLTYREIIQKVQSVNFEIDNRNLQKQSFFIRSNGKVYPFSEKINAFLGSFYQGNTLEMALTEFSIDEHEQVISLFDKCISNYLLRKGSEEKMVLGGK